MLPPTLPLVSLDLSGCGGLTDAGLRHVAERCPLLHTVKLVLCGGVGDDGVAALARGCGTALRRLDCTGCAAVTSKGVGVLAVLRREDLDFAGNTYGGSVRTVACGQLVQEEGRSGAEGHIPYAQTAVGVHS